MFRRSKFVLIRYHFQAVTSNLPTIRFPEPKSTVPILNPETQSSSDAQASKPTNPSEKVESKPSEEDEYVRVMKKLQFGKLTTLMKFTENV